MYIRNLLFVAGVAAAKAAPAAFTLMALRSGSDFHFSPIAAANGSLFLNLKDQGANCDSKTSQNSATFQMKGTSVYLYSDNPPSQELFADRSGMGQGVLNYITGAETVPTDGEVDGWAIDGSDDLKLDGADFIACPLNHPEGSWYLWVSSGVPQPAGNKGCLGLTARVVEDKAPVSCEYTS